MIPPPPESNHGEHDEAIPPPPSEQEEVQTPVPSKVKKSQKDAKSLREIAAEGLPFETREQMLLAARDAGLTDDDAAFWIIWLVREGDKTFTESVSSMKALKEEVLTALNDAPEKLTGAVADIMRLSQLNREEAIINRENSNAGKGLIKWGVGLAGGVLLLGIIQTALISSITHTASQIQEQREQLVERVESVQHLQSIAGRRLQIEAEKREFKGWWKELQENWRTQGETEENLSNKTRLEELHRALEAKEIKIYEDEDNAFKTLKN